jgi:hypothetical protein
MTQLQKTTLLKGEGWRIPGVRFFWSNNPGIFEILWCNPNQIRASNQ